MEGSSPRQRAEADDSLASWIKETCPELPEIIREHIQSMTGIDGQRQDVLLRLILLSVRIHIPHKCADLFKANAVSDELGTAVRDLCRSKGSSSQTAIDHTIAVLRKYKEQSEAVQ